MSTSTLVRQISMLKMIPKYPAFVLTKDVYQRLIDEGFITTKRTVERDLLKLSDVMGLRSGESPEGNKWAYENHVRELLPALSPNEALLLLQAKEFLSHIMPVKSLLALEPRFNKAAETLAEGSQFKGWQKKIHIASNVSLIQTYISEDLREIVYNAVLKAEQLKIKFTRNNGERVDSIVNAHGLIIKEHMQYLVHSRIDLPNELRLIKLPNIIEVENNYTDNQPCEADVEQFIHSNSASFKLSQEKIKVQMKVAGPAKLLFENSKLSADQTIEYFIGQNEKKCGVLTATTEFTHDFVHFILGYGKWVEVLEPQSLIDAINNRKSGNVF
ncbi:MAG: helix-turn-helix transcriptional regulator [Cognaticolwellia sp.]